MSEAKERDCQEDSFDADYIAECMSSEGGAAAVESLEVVEVIEALE